MLSDNVPNEINCRDSSGRKQGWWIHYKVEYNPTIRPDYLDSGNYVADYSYGKYKDNKKIGRWVNVNNVHEVYASRIDSFYNGKDTVGIYSSGWYFNTVVEYIKDSIIINSKRIEKGDTIYIFCDKYYGNINAACRMIYHDKVFKKFPYADFEKEFYSASEQIYFYNQDLKRPRRTKH